MAETKRTETQAEANERMEEALGQTLKWIVGDTSEVTIRSGTGKNANGPGKVTATEAGGSRRGS